MLTLKRPALATDRAWAGTANRQPGQCAALLPGQVADSI